MPAEWALPRDQPWVLPLRLRLVDNDCHQQTYEILE